MKVPRLKNNRWYAATDRKQIRERNKTIRARRKRGESLRSIGRSFNLSHERIRQICNGEGP